MRPVYKPQEWAIEWRGVVTRNIGVDYELAETKEQAREQFQSRYPMREVVSVDFSAR